MCIVGEYLENILANCVRICGLFVSVPPSWHSYDHNTAFSSPLHQILFPHPEISPDSPISSSSPRSKPELKAPSLPRESWSPFEQTKCAEVFAGICLRFICCFASTAHMQSLTFSPQNRITQTVWLPTFDQEQIYYRIKSQCSFPPAFMIGINSPGCFHTSQPGFNTTNNPQRNNIILTQRINWMILSNPPWECT